MKNILIGGGLAVAFLAFSPSSYASANDWIREQQATDPGYNGYHVTSYSSSNSSNSYQYDNEDDYDYLPSSNSRYVSRSNQRNTQHISQPPARRSAQTTVTYVDQSHAKFNIFNYIYQYFY